ncbi:MAG: response regulator transcription factor [Hyphomicrobiaceae bacterium]|nr:response regulator transcription factor [Hyphomicrobiaceae bacterium]
MSSPRVRIAIIDDHPLFRAGVIHVLQGAAVGIEVVGEGSAIEDAVAIAKRERPDVMLLDIGIKGGGLAAAMALSELYPSIKIIMLTISESEEDVSGAMQAGARGYLLKGISSAELVRVIAAVHRGELYVMPELAARLLQRPRAAKPNQVNGTSNLSDLTYREDQIVRQLARGLTNKEIARQLNVSEKTIKHHMTNIMQKLHARNRVEVALVVRGAQASPAPAKRV